MSFVLCCRFAGALEGPVQGAGLSKGDMEDRLLPMQQVSPPPPPTPTPTPSPRR